MGENGIVKRLCLIALSLMMSSLALAQSSENLPFIARTPVNSEGNLVWVAQPNTAHVNSATRSINGSQLTLTAQMGASLAIGHDSMIMLVYLKSGKVIVSHIGDAKNESLGMGKDSTALIDTNSGTNLASGSRIINGSQITINLNSQLIANDEIVRVEVAYADEQTVLAYGMDVLDKVAHAAFFFAQAPSSYASRAVYFGSQRVNPKLEDPGSGLWQVPPYAITPQPGDVTGDGRPDYRPGGGYQFPETGIIVEPWIQDNAPAGPSSNDQLVTVIGYDLNNNGKLEPSEVAKVIGVCVYDPGCSTYYGEMENGHWVAHHINFEDTNGNHQLDPGEKVTHYVYNMVIGVWKIWRDGVRIQ